MKISKLLPITLALMLGLSGAAYAEESGQGQATTGPKDTDSAIYELTLPEFFNVTATSPTATEVTYNNDYTTATITGSLEGNFHVVSNTNTKIVYIYGTCLAGGGEVPALYGADEDTLKLIFTNTAEEGGTATSASVVEAMRVVGGVAAENSPNAVAFNLTIEPKLVADSYPEGKSISAGTIEEEGSNVQYTIPNCKANFGCTVSGSTQDTSFSTLDTNGLYRATLYLSTTPQTL